MISFKSIEDILNSQEMDITDYGPIEKPVKYYELYRNDKQQLMFKTELTEQSSSSFINPPIGTVEYNEDTITLSFMSYLI